MTPRGIARLYAVAAALVLILSTSSLAAQTAGGDVPIPLPEASPFEIARFDLDRARGPGGENADAYYEARDRARSLEAKGEWADALEEWEKAYAAVEKALLHAEFGTTPRTMGFGASKFTMQMPVGFHRRAEVREHASEAAHRAGDSAAAVRWADGDRTRITEFEAQARAEGREKLADQYRVTLLDQELDSLMGDLLYHRRRTEKRLTLLAVYEGMLLLIAVVVAWRGLRRRPRFTYLNEGRHPRSGPQPTSDWKPTVAASIGGLFGLGFVARLIEGTFENGHRDTGVVLLIVSVLATCLVLWVFVIALTRRPTAKRQVPRALDELDPVKTDGLSELRAWFDANARALCADFGVGRFKRGRLDRTVPAVSDPMLRSALAAWLGGQLHKRSIVAPAFLDEQVSANLGVHPVGAWEPLVAPYVRGLGTGRRDAVLAEVPRGAVPVLGGPVVEPDHTGLVAQWLELMMISGRRWTAESWNERFNDPALSAMVSSVIWGAFEDQAFVTSFRCDAEGGLVSLGYVSVEPASLRGLEIAVAHPADLTGEDLDAWERELADFEAVALFDQLGRRMPEPMWRYDEPGAKLDTQIGLGDGGLERLLDHGWERCSVGLQRALHPFGLTAQAHLDFLKTTCTAVSFHLGYLGSYHNGAPATPDQVSSVAVAEVLFALRSAVSTHD